MWQAYSAARQAVYELLRISIVILRLPSYPLYYAQAIGKMPSSGKYVPGTVVPCRIPAPGMARPRTAPCDTGWPTQSSLSKNPQPGRPGCILAVSSLKAGGYAKSWVLRCFRWDKTGLKQPGGSGQEFEGRGICEKYRAKQGVVKKLT